MRLLVALLVSIAASVAAASERRVALVMGADDYRMLRPLENAVNDAETLEETLRGLGFDVTVETNRDLKRMRRALDDFREDGAGADVALVFFAGHGVEMSGENRLAPVDADASSVEALQASTLPLEEVRAAVADVGRVGLVMLDACRNDPFSGGAAWGRSAEPLSAEVEQTVQPGLGRMGRSENVLFAFAAAPGETAADGEAGNSPFSAALAKYLGTEGLEIRSVLTLVQQEVYDRSRGGQLPYVESGLPKLFFASAARDELPERERLLLAMADMSPDMRHEVEQVATQHDVPLAPLFGAFVGGDLGRLGVFERNAKLSEAAKAFNEVRLELQTLSMQDPEVTRLRGQAEEQLSTGQFDAARASLLAAADVDARSIDVIENNLNARILSLASTHIIAANAAQVAMRYEDAASDFEKAFEVLARLDLTALPDDDGSRVLRGLEAYSLVHAVLGRFESATPIMERRYEVARERFHKNPASLARKLDYARALFFEIAPKADDGTDEQAWEQGRELLDIARKLVEADRRNGEHAFLLAEAAGRVATMTYFRGDDVRAFEIAHGAISMIEAGRLHRADDDGNLLLAAGQLHIALARLLILAGAAEEAVSNFRLGLSYVEAGAGKRPNDLIANMTLAQAYLELHEGLGWTGGLGEAVDVLVAGRDRMRALQVRDSGNPAWADSVAMFEAEIEAARELIRNCGEDGEICKTDDHE